MTAPGSHAIVSFVRELLVKAAWLPVGVFLTHVAASVFLDAYDRWPALDVPMHVMGGVAMAWFIATGLDHLRRHGLHAPLSRRFADGFMSRGPGVGRTGGVPHSWVNSMARQHFRVCLSREGHEP